MKYNFDNVSFWVSPKVFTKECPKEKLQYAVGALLYMPADKKNVASKIISGEFSYVKSLVLDLEDSLGDDNIHSAFDNIVNFCKEINDAIDGNRFSHENIPLIFVRVRCAEHMNMVVESLGSLVKIISGFNIPKFGPSSCDEYISTFKSISEKVMNEYSSKLYMMPILESDAIMDKQVRTNNLSQLYDKLLEIKDSVLNIRVGGADFNNIFGIRRGCKDTIWDTHVVADCLADIVNVFGKDYVVSGPVWEFFEGSDAINGLQAEIHKDLLNGCFGKTCIHPNQLLAAQECYIVDYNDYQDAVDVLNMDESASGVKKSIQGRMNEKKTHSKWAKKTIELAHIYGVR